MTYRNILVHVDAGRSAAARIDLAFAIAARDEGFVIGAHPTVPEFLPAYFEAGPEIMQLQQNLADEETVKSRALFEACAAKAGCPNEWRALSGPARTALAIEGRYADLVVVGQDDPENGATTTPADLAADLIFSTGRPVLMVPYIGAQGAVGRRVLIAWSETREGARAVADAMPFLTRAEAVTVLTVSREAEVPDPAARLCEALVRRGVQATPDHVVGSGLDPAELLLSRAADISADLIVMGAYGHARLRQQILGGVTQTLLEHATVPVLMSH